ncbi:tetraspanin-14 isoform X2 [Alosa alosa]|uniref:tetraspanin-14 isoform X2 n=1 Tax=Alosa alosa TaxID=278164 RepID=UPI00201506E0|nr:tetraspanin-14 isoform X2 [Alosa alosa]
MHYYRYESAEVSCCYKYLMFSYNIVFWLAGALFICAGFWAWSEKGVLLDLTQVTRQHGFDPVWVVLLVGTVTFILGFAGCVGALRENICLLKFFSGIIVLIFFLELTVAVLAFMFQDYVREWVNDLFLQNVKAYREDIDLQNLIDSLQRVDNVVNTQCGYDVRSSGTLTKWAETIYIKGCITALEDWLPRNIYIVAGVFMVISLLQMVGIYLSRTLIGDIEKVKLSY